MARWQEQADALAREDKHAVHRHGFIRPARKPRLDNVRTLCRDDYDGNRNAKVASFGPPERAMAGKTRHRMIVDEIERALRRIATASPSSEAQAVGRYT